MHFAERLQIGLHYLDAQGSFRCRLLASALMPAYRGPFPCSEEHSLVQPIQVI